MGRKSKKSGNGKSRKQPKVGRWPCKEHRNKYAKMSIHKHDAYGIKEEGIKKGKERVV